MRQRVLAIVGAIALVVVAFVVRGLLTDGGSDGGGSRSSRPVVACTADLAELCDALAGAGRIAADPPTLDLSAAASPPAEVDGWITWDPAPAIAGFDAGGTEVWSEPQVLASAREAVLYDPAVADALTDACRAAPTWRCLAADPGAIPFGVGDPSTAEGLARLAPLAQTFTIDDDPDQLDVAGLRDLVESPRSAQAPSHDQAVKLVTQRGSYGLVAGPNDLLEAQANSAQGRSRSVQVLTPTPSRRLTVVLATRHGRSLGGLADACGGAAADLAPAARRLGLQPCEGTADAGLAGFLYQVRKKVG